MILEFEKTELSGQLYSRAWDKEISKRINKTVLKNMSQFKLGINKMPVVERNEFGYGLNNIGVLIDSDSNLKFYIDLYYDNEDGFVGVATFTLDYSKRNNKFYSESSRGYTILSYPDFDNMQIDMVMDDGDYRYVLEKFKNRVYEDKVLKSIFYEVAHGHSSNYYNI
jgi:hypothetical protein